MATAQDVITSVRRLLNDEVSSFVSGVRATDQELLMWLTDAQREIVLRVPEANAITALHSVIDGLPRQRLDANVAAQLVRVEANGEDYYIVTSKLYPAEIVEAITAAGSLLRASEISPPMDAVNATASILAGELRAILQTYTNWPAEAVSVAPDIVSGVLHVELISYTNWPAEAVSVAPDIVSGVLHVELISYTNAAPEGVAVSSQILSGTLT